MKVYFVPLMIAGFETSIALHTGRIFGALTTCPNNFPYFEDSPTNLPGIRIWQIIQISRPLVFPERAAQAAKQRPHKLVRCLAHYLRCQVLHECLSLLPSIYRRDVFTLRPQEFRKDVRLHVAVKVRRVGVRRTRQKHLTRIIRMHKAPRDGHAFVALRKIATSVCDSSA